MAVSTASNCLAVQTAVGEPIRVPGQVSEMSEKSSERAPLMKIEHEGVIYNCHFFTKQGLELDIVPQEIILQRELDVTANVPTGIGNSLDQVVILTDENSPAVEWFRFNPETAEVEFRRA